MTFSSGQIAQAALISQVGGSVTSGIGSYNSATVQQANLRGQSAVLAANADTSNVNAKLADLNAQADETGAQSALSQGNQQVAALTLRAGQLKSAQRANLAANGVDLGVGSAAEIQASSEIMKDIDVSTIRANAARTAWGYRVQGLNAKMQGLNATMQAGNQRLASLVGNTAAGAISPLGSAGASFLGSAGSVAQSWYQYSKTDK